MSAPPEDMHLALLEWYDREGRALSFRETRDPWAILVSEAMAQQTQAARAGDAWRSFMNRYPTPSALAAASSADVLRAWRGLGYNRRAVALRRAAQAIVAEHDGQVPSEVAVLERLPGVGPYTARAVAAFAFGQRVAPVDTNVRRVIGRVMAVGGDGRPSSPRAFQALADSLVDGTRPGDWSHALMDVGATLCRPTRPACPTCPMRAWCRFASGVAATRAVGRRIREPTAPFETTSRWLRGRIVDRLRDGDDGAWVPFVGPIGGHDGEAIARALEALSAEGLAEVDRSDGIRARLPTSGPMRTARSGR